MALVETKSGPHDLGEALSVARSVEKDSNTQNARVMFAAANRGMLSLLLNYMLTQAAQSPPAWVLASVNSVLQVGHMTYILVTDGMH